MDFDTNASNIILFLFQMKVNFQQFFFVNIVMLVSMKNLIYI
jgi:hypothetical protein